MSTRPWTRSRGLGEWLFGVVAARVVLEGASRVVDVDGLAFAVFEQGFVAECGSGEHVVRYLLEA